MIKREEALSIFEKWRLEKSPVSCFATLAGLGFTIIGTIDELLEDRMSIVSSDKHAKFFLGFAPDDDLRFEYADSLRALPNVPAEEVKIVSGVGVALPTRREKVFVFELVREDGLDT